MTVQVDFYLINPTDEIGRYQFACRVIEKAYHRQHQLYAHCPDAAAAQRLDELLWTFRKESFVPHNLYGEGPTPPPPIQIGSQTTPTNQRDILLNLTADVPDFWQKFHRIIEIIPSNDDAKEQARQRYRFYKQQHCQLTSHQVE